MVESTFPTDRPTESVCPWCSTSVTPETAVCSSCGAILTSDGEPDLPGVTAVDTAILRGEKKPKSRSRLLSWISGEYVDEKPAVSDSQAVAPPDADVQREILRLEIEAEVANLQAQVDAMRAEAVAEGRVLELPPDVEALVDEAGAEIAADPETPSPDVAPPA